MLYKVVTGSRLPLTSGAGAVAAAVAAAIAGAGWTHFNIVLCAIYNLTYVLLLGILFSWFVLVGVVLGVKYLYSCHNCATYRYSFILKIVNRSFKKCL